MDYRAIIYNFYNEHRYSEKISKNDFVIQEIRKKLFIYLSFKIVNY